MNLAEMKAKYNSLIESATKLGEEFKASQDEELTVKINAILDESEALKSEIEEAEKRLDEEASAQATLDRLNKLNEAKPSKTQEEAVLTGIKVKPTIEGDANAGFRDMGEFAMTVFRANPNVGAVSDSRLTYLQEKAAASGLNAGVGHEGGYTVPSKMSETILGTMLGDSDSLLGRANTITVEGESLTIPGIDESSRATGSRYGGVRGYWIAEADQMTSSKPKFRKIKLEPNQLAVFTYVTDKLLSTSGVALNQLITRAAVDEINWLVGNSIINGTGAGQPLGIITSSGKVSQAKESGQAAATVVAANIDKMWSRFPARQLANAVWFVNQDILPSIESLETSNGQPLFRGPDGLASSPVGTLKGRPIVPLEYCKTLGTEGDIILADMSSYVAGIQGSVESEMSMHLRFDYNEMAFRWVFAVDGQPSIATPLTPANGTNTLSPFVSLAVRA